MYQGEDITEHNNQRKLNILKGFVEVTDIIEKGHMDFGGGKAPAGGKGNLVQKKITDKSGHNTTRWVKNGQEETGQDKSNVEAEQSSEGVKTSDDHAKETQSEDLKTYIANNPDGEHVAAAQAELQARGESDDMGTQGGEQMGTAQDDFSEVSDEELYNSIEYLVSSDGDASYALAEFKKRGGVVEDWMMSDEGGEEQQPQDVYQTPSQESLDSYYAMDEQGQRSVLEASMKHNIPFGAALSMVMESGQGGNTEAHGALDAAQQALDAAKSATGHPGATNSDSEEMGDNGSANFSDSDVEAMFDPNQPEFDVNDLDNNGMDALQNAMKSYASNPENTYAKEVSDYLSEFGDEDEEGDEDSGTENYDKEVSEGGGGDSNFHNQDEEEDEDQGGGDSNFHNQDKEKDEDEEDYNEVDEGSNYVRGVNAGKSKNTHGNMKAGETTRTNSDGEEEKYNLSDDDPGLNFGDTYEKNISKKTDEDLLYEIKAKKSDFRVKIAKEEAQRRGLNLKSKK